MNKKVVCVIPARLHSTRFPKKILTQLLDKPLLQWVFEAASKVKIFSEIIFAIDSTETASLLETFNAPYIMTSENCPSGTHRLIEVMQSGKIKSDIWVNWQGDEPFINSNMINELLQSINDNNINIWTLKKEIINFNEVNSSNIAKVVCDINDNAIYFSRSPIPFYRDEKDFSKQKYFKHVGLYAFTTDALEQISKLNECYLEKAELLEQLRFLYYGLKIKTHNTNQEVLGIDLPEHLIQATEYIKKNFLNNR